MAIDLKWNAGLPEQTGLYFVAVKLGEAAGVYDFLVWNGESWEDLAHGQVIAFIGLQDFKNSLDINWPVESTLSYQARELGKSDSELWREG